MGYEISFYYTMTMKKKILIRNKLLTRPYIKEIVDMDKNILDCLKKAWNNLPDDVTSDERMLFIELIEKTLRLYRNAQGAFNEEDTTKN